MIDRLTVDLIRRNIPPRYFERGLRYQRQGYVLSVDWDEDLAICYAEVRGSGRKVYELEIAIEEDFSIFGDCSCPVGFNCKHVAAALLHWVASTGSVPGSRKTTPEEELEKWQEKTLERLQEAFANPYPEPGQICLLHLLVPKIRHGFPVVELITVKSRRLKRGGDGARHRLSTWKH